jgi:hypothetical protein
MSMPRRSVPILLVLAMVAWAGVTHACVMCGSSFGEDDPTAKAFMSSVLFLVAAPYTIFLTAAAIVFFLYRRGSGGRRASVVSLARWRANPPAESPKEVTP